MNPAPQIIRIASAVALFVCVGAIARSQAEASNGHHPMGLPRLAGLPAKAGDRPMDRDKFEVFAIAASAEVSGANDTIRTRRSVAYIDVSPGKEWSRTLRSQHPGANYVTFAVNCSIGTEIHLGSVKLAVLRSTADSMYGAVMYRAGPLDQDNWKPLNYETQLLPFAGTMMASLAPITLKLDTIRGRWSVWLSDSLLADDLPLASPTGENAANMTVKAGSGGAWVWGIACSDENPLFEDSNHNAVPDDFEVSQIGQLMPADVSAESQKLLKQACLDERESRPPSTFDVVMPPPDFIPELCGPNGAPVHGMANSLRYRPSANK